jgi:hypothetical protein
MGWRQERNAKYDNHKKGCAGEQRCEKKKSIKCSRRCSLDMRLSLGWRYIFYVGAYWERF